jgi:signal transduction histidine kinase
MSDGSPETYDELVASRARVLAQADRSRRALQGELHDGAQQRLVHALIALKLARSALEAGSPAADLVDEALANVEQANRDLRAVVHRILPRPLVHAGLPSGLRSLVDELAVPVGLRVDVPRLRREDETTAYVVVAELVTAALAQADVRRVEVDVRLDGGTLTLDVRHAGARHGDGTDDLAGARDRVRAAGGRLTVTDAVDGGTVLRAELPVQPGDSLEPDLGARRA